MSLVDSGSTSKAPAVAVQLYRGLAPCVPSWIRTSTTTVISSGYTFSATDNHFRLGVCRGGSPLRSAVELLLHNYPILTIGLRPACSRLTALLRLMRGRSSTSY